MQQKKPWKRFLTIFMVLALILGTIPFEPVILTVYADTPTSLQGSGTNNDPYLIGSEADWALFAKKFESNTDLDKCYKLTNDIEVDGTLGTSNKPFQGILDGDGHTIKLTVGSPTGYYNSECVGLFAFAKNASINNLHVTGDIYTEKKYAGGFVGEPSGECVFNACRSSVAIHSGVNGDGTHGLFIGVARGKVTLNNCLADGQLLGDKTDCCGGFVGWHDDSYYATFNSCLFAPTDVTISTSGSATFSRNESNKVIVSNCYYIGTFGKTDNSAINAENMKKGSLCEALGKKWALSSKEKVPVPYASKLLGKDLANATVEDATFTCKKGFTTDIDCTIHDLAGTELKEGIDYNMEFYAKDSNLQLTSVKQGGEYEVKLIPATGSTYTGEGLVTINVEEYLAGKGTQESPFIISDEEDWNLFAKSVNEGKFADSFYRLSSSIGSKDAITKMVGVKKETPFKGTFDGCGNTINMNITDTANREVSLFHYISGATIKNVKTTGTVEGNLHCAGLVGLALDGTTNTIKNCQVSVNVKCTGGGHSHCGGVLGHGTTSKTTITDCLFDGTITGATTAVGIIYGWGDNGTHKIVNCLEEGSYVNCSGVDLIKSDTGKREVINSYRRNNVGSSGTLTSESAEDLKIKLGSGWMVKNGKVVPVMNTIPEHRVTVLETEGGTVTTEAEDFQEYATVVLTAVPEEDYCFGGVTVSVSDNDLEVAGGLEWYSYREDNLPHFIMPKEDVTVKPVFVKADSVSVNMLAGEHLTVKVPEQIKAFMVYDDGGKDKPYKATAKGIDSVLTVTVPEGYHPKLTGKLDMADDVNFYDAPDAQGSSVLTLSGEQSIDKAPLISGQDLTIKLHAEGEDEKPSGFALLLEMKKDEDVCDQGTCGDNLTWDLTYGGTLSIKGNGAMNDYEMFGPWRSDSKILKEVKIGSEVTSIGSYAFKDLVNLQNVLLPAGVTVVGENAFDGCSSLKSIHVGAEKIQFNEDTFQGCKDLSDLYLDSISWAQRNNLQIEEDDLPAGCEIHYSDDPWQTLTLPENMEIVTDADAKLKKEGKYRPDARITFAPKQYYKAENVKVNGVEAVSENGIYEVVIPAEDAKVTADVERIKYPVIYVLDEDVDNQENPENTNAGEVLVLNDPVREGYKFLGWYTDEDLTAKWNPTQIITSEITLYADWSKNVSYAEANYLVLPENMEIVKDAPDKMKVDGKYKPGAVILVKVKENYDAKNVFVNDLPVEPVENGIYTIEIGDKDVRVTADIGLSVYHITYVLDEGENNPENPDTFTEENRNTLKIGEPSKEGFIFKGWYTDEAFTTGWDAKKVDKKDYTLYAKWVKGVTYLDENGVEQICSDYTVITSETRDLFGAGTTGSDSSGWYVVDRDVDIDEQLAVASRTANIILCDGATLRATKGIKVAKGTTEDWSGRATTLKIYGQSEGTGTIEAEGADGFGGIGGASFNHGCTVDIYGGTIYAKGDDNASGLGGGGTVCEVNIYGGTVIAKGGKNGSGIGGTDIPEDYKAYACNIRLNGGNISSDSYIGTVTVADGRYFVDEEGNRYEGNVDNDAIAGKMIFCACRVGFHTAGGSKIEEYYAERGKKLEELQMPEKEGFEFAGWYKDPEYSSEWTETDIVTQDMVLYAKWAPVLDDEDISLAGKLVYNGEEQFPEVVYAGKTLEYGKDYTINVDGQPVAAGEYDGTISFTGEYAGAIPCYFCIEKAPLTVDDVEMADKVYDGSVTAKSDKVTLSGVIGDDDVKAEAEGEFETAGVGKDKKVVVKSYTLTGKDAGNYQVESKEIEKKADIEVCPVTIKGLTVNDKVYDKTRKATVSGNAVLEGKAGADEVVIVAGKAEFDTVYAGENKTVTFSGYSIEGKDAGNYKLAAQPESVTADILKAEPVYKKPKNKTITCGETLEDIELKEGFSFATPDQKLKIGKNEVTLIYEPIDANNYRTVDDITMIVTVKHNLIETKEKAATATQAGNHAYFTCSECGRYFADANGEKEIAKDSWIIPASGAKEGTKTAGIPAVGTILKDATGTVEYKVLVADQTAPVVAYSAFKGSATSIAIPATVTLDGVTYQVSEIEANAFKGNKSLKQVTIGEGVKVIGDSAFEGCSSLTKVIIPASVEKIGKNAFKGCKKLKNVKIKTVKLTKKSVGKNAFKGIHAKAKVKVPKKQLKAYQAILKKAGIKGKNQKITK